MAKACQYVPSRVLLGKLVGVAAEAPSVMMERKTRFQAMYMSSHFRNSLIFCCGCLVALAQHTSCGLCRVHGS